MKDTEISDIEASLGFRLPEAYKSTMRNYPFASESFANEFMLPNRASDVLNLNQASVTICDIRRPFFIGSDGGEELYFVDACKGVTQVFVYELETRHHRIFATSWPEYLEHLRRIHAEIAADWEAQRRRKLRKSWWKIWK